MKNSFPLTRRSLTRSARTIPTLLRTALALGTLIGITAASTSAAQSQQVDPSQQLALTGATIHPVSGPVIEKGTLLIEGDTIRAVGSTVSIPPAARLIDLSGKHVYPGFIHPSSVLGLSEIGNVRGSVDVRESGDLHPDLRAEVAFHGDSRLLPATTSGGVLYALVAPQGGLISGTSAVMRLDGWNWRDMTLRSPVAMHLRFPTFVASGRRTFRGPPKTQKEVDEERKEDLGQMKDLFAAAHAYQKARSVERASAPRRAGKALPALSLDPKLEAMLPVLDGSVRVFLHAREKTQIEGALEFAAEEKLKNVVLVTSADAAELASRLAKLEIPVILDGVLRLPARSWQGYDSAFTAAAKLHEAGVTVIIGDGGGGFGAANARNLPFQAAMAAAHGLPAEEALRSITLNPAKLLGIDDRLGSLEAGKEASLIVTDGDPLEITTHIEQVWLAGKPLDLGEDPQRRLYERYRQRPAAEPAD